VRWLPWLVGAAGAAVGLTVASVLSRDDRAAGGAGPVDPYAPDDPTRAVDLTAKPGVRLFRAWVTGRWGERTGSPENILRDGANAGTPSNPWSEHHEGRAWDWMLPGPDPLAAGQALVDELLATSAEGDPHAIARRAGIQYLIFNRRMWRAYPHAGAPAGTWSDYHGASPHTDHVHVSFSRAGARGATSLYPWLRAHMPAAEHIA